LLRSLWCSFVHYRDAGRHGNLVQQNIAADPTGAASRRRERFTAFDRGQRKCEMRDEKDCADGRCVEVVMQYEEIGSSVFEKWHASFRSRRRRRFWCQAASIGFLVGRETCTPGRNNRLPRCFVAQRRAAVIHRTGRRSLPRPRIRCRRGHAGRHSYSGRDRQSGDASPRGD